MTGPTTPPEGIDPDRPSPARIYDCFLGGSHNFAADREVAKRAIAVVPRIPAITRANRAFLRRAVRAVAADGIGQFVDLGSGIPTEGNVHEIVRRVEPDARVVYVDIDPVAVIHSRKLLAGHPGTTVVQADLRDADRVLDHPDVREMINFDRPVCLLMVAVLHFVPDDERLRRALARYRDAVCPGSYLIVSHVTDEGHAEEAARMTQLYSRTSAPLVPRSRSQVGDLLTGWTVIEPGIVDGPLWRPDPGEPAVPDPASYATLALVARKEA